MTNKKELINIDNLFLVLKSLIDTSKQKLAYSVNETITKLYWEIGNCINDNILKNQRAEYGKQIVLNISNKLQQEYGERIFSEKNIHRMMQFASIFPNREIVATLLRQFSWSHFTLFIPIQDELKRNFYMEMCRIEKWSVRTR